MPASPTLIVFDLGGVLVRICRSWQEACSRAGLHYDPAVIEPERVDRRKHLRHAYERGQIGCDEFFGAIAATTEGLYSPDQVRTVHDSWLIAEYDGAAELIGDLHRAGRWTGVLSNTNHSHWTRMSPHAFAAANAPRLRHASHLLGHSKPDEAIYRAFEVRARASGWTGPAAEILFFDDLPENVEAAVRAGWDAHQIDHTGDTAQQMREALAARGVELGRHESRPSAASATFI